MRAKALSSRRRVWALAALAATTLMGATPGLYYTSCVGGAALPGLFEVFPTGGASSQLLFGAFETLPGGSGVPTGIALDPIGERAFIAHADLNFSSAPHVGGIWIFGLDGSYQGTLLTAAHLGQTAIRVSGLALDVQGAYLYAGIEGPTITGQIIAIDLVTSSFEFVAVPNALQPWEIEVDPAANKIYWTEHGGLLRRADIGGANAETLLASSDAKGLALDLAAGKLYTSNIDGIHRANLDGSDLETILPPAPNQDAITLALDPAGTLYWSNGVDTIFWGDPDAMAPNILTETALNAGSMAVLLPECRDGYDNDGDGFIDYLGDPACQTNEFTREKAQCQDGVDNDGQPGIDFDGGASVNGGVPLDVADPHCDGKPWRNVETPPSSCGLGAEIAIALGALSTCRSRRRNR